MRSRWSTLHAFNEPTKRALEAGIPVFSYNADAKGNDRLAYIGQDLYASGQALGRRIVDLVEGGPRRRLHRDAGPAQHPAASRRRQGRHQGVGQEDRARVRSPPARQSTRKCRGSTPITSDTRTSRACSRSMRAARWRSARRWRSTGFTPKACTPAASICFPQTLDAIASDHLDFTIDQQPYLQGFYTVMEMAMFKLLRRP